MKWTENLGLWASLYRLFCLWSYAIIDEVYGELRYLIQRIWRAKECTKPPFRVSLKRVLVLWCLAILLPFLCIWNHLGFFLDDILFPRWRQQSLGSPLFLVGNARSGTTWLHRVLTESDPTVFTTFRTWEILFAVPIIWKCLFYRLYTFDRRWLRGILLSCVLSVERRVLGENGIHQFGLLRAEEDEWLMIHIGYAQLLLFFFPTATALANPLILFDCHSETLSDLTNSLSSVLAQSSSLAQATQDFHHQQLQRDVRQMLPVTVRWRIFSYYRECVQRHLYFATSFRTPNNPDHPCPIFVSKNPTFTLRLQTLKRTFPEGKVLSLLRPPLQSVPSMISYISCVWHTVATPSQRYPQASLLLSFCLLHYLYPAVHLSLSTDVISYLALQRHLGRTVTQCLAEHYGPSIFTSQLLHALQNEEDTTRNFVSSHRYSLSECVSEMSERDLTKAFDLVYHLYGDLLK